jgi:hypothetical protein
LFEDSQMIYKSLQYQRMNIMKEPDKVATMFRFTIRVFRFGKPLNKWKGIYFISFTTEIKFEVRKVYLKLMDIYSRQACNITKKALWNSIYWYKGTPFH